MIFSRRSFFIFGSGLLSNIWMWDIFEMIKQNESFVVFIARTPYDAPIGRIVKIFENHSIGSWFEKYWQSKESTKSVFGADLQGLAGILRGNENFKLKTTEKFLPSLKEAIDGAVYNSSLHVEERAIEIISDDDEQSLLYYWFDSNFFSENKSLLAYLASENWLPTVVSLNKIEKPQPYTYVCYCYPDDSLNTEDWSIVKIEGHRLDRLGDIKEKLSHLDSESFLDLIKDYPKEISWSHAIAKVVASDSPKSRSVFQCSEHVSELYHHFDTFEFAKSQKRIIRKLIVFDDIWYSSHPILAESIFALKSGKIISGK